MQAIHINSFELEPIAQDNHRKFQKVFLVDNNPLDTLNNTAVLQHLDFAEELTLFESAKSAFECIRNAERMNDVPDLIFLNLDMPGMDGFNFLSRFSELNDFTRKRCKIVILSAGHDDESRRKCLLNRHVVQYLPKQLNEKMLAQFIN